MCQWTANNRLPGISFLNPLPLSSWFEIWKLGNEGWWKFGIFNTMTRGFNLLRHWPLYMKEALPLVTTRHTLHEQNPNFQNSRPKPESFLCTSTHTSSSIRRLWMRKISFSNRLGILAFNTFYTGCLNFSFRHTQNKFIFNQSKCFLFNPFICRVAGYK